MIAIKNIEMPSGCYDCPFTKNKRTNDYGSFCECGILEDYETINLLEHSKHPNCPLVKQEPILDKIRAEIKALSPKPTAYDVVDGNPVKDAIWETLVDVLQIIDKYKAESEDKE